MKLDKLVKKLPGRKLYSQLQILKCYWGLANDPTSIELAFKLGGLLGGAMREIDPEGAAAYFASHPIYAPMLAERYEAPAYTLEDLAKYEPNTLGYAYYRHMMDNNLKLDYYPTIEVVDDFSYIHSRLSQTHDIWHVVSGFGTDVVGELGLQGYYLGQSNNDEFFAMTLISAGCLYAALKEQRIMSDMIQAIGAGFNLGKAAKSFHPAHWEEMWDRPLADIRAEFNVTPPKVGGIQPKVAEPELVAV
jgi:ubiquinone biosynthesis protein COQ4